ncbi:MAG: SDR family oxidoreductase [Acidobacteriota bacterium]
MSEKAKDRSLAGRICLVAGATRGAGRGIACMLGEAGATVICTGRSVRGQPATEGRPETLEETAERVDAHGGRGIALRTDHTVPEQVTALLDRVRKDHRRLDVLVNDIWGGDALTEWGQPFWKLSVDKGRTLFERAVHSHILTSQAAVPLMLEGDRGLIVEMTDGEHFGYRLNLYFDLVKITVIRLAFAMSRDLHRTGITALALTPGFMRSEGVLDHFGVSEDNWRDAIEQDPYFAASETPSFVGRAVAALAADPEVKRKNGRLFSSWDLAEEYGFDDIDGRRPHWTRKLKEQSDTTYRPCDEAFYADYWLDGPGEQIFPDWLGTSTE